MKTRYGSSRLEIVKFDCGDNRSWEESRRIAVK